jgi:hypothetical protein
MKPRKNDLIDPGLIPSLSAPDAIRHKLTANVSETVEHQDYVRSDVAQERRRGTVWRGDEACLGSVNLDNSWSQRRPVLGYWRVDDDVAVLRVRIMHSGRDFASGLIHAAQERNELLVAGTLATNLGDSHPILDRPEEGVFDVRDFSLCVELGGPGAMVQAMGQDRFALGAGDWQAVVRPAFARISGCEVRWEIASEADRAVVRAVVNAGRAFKLHPQALEEAIIGLHLSVQRKPETVPGELPGELPGAMVELGETSRGGDVVLKATSVQRRLTLCAPRRPGEYREFCPARPRRALQATADR